MFHIFQGIERGSDQARRVSLLADEGRKTPDKLDGLTYFFS